MAYALVVSTSFKVSIMSNTLFFHLALCLAPIATQRYHLSPPLHTPNMVHDQRTHFLP